MPVFLQFADTQSMALAAIFLLLLVFAVGIPVVLLLKWAFKPALEAWEKPMPQAQALTAEPQEQLPELLPELNDPTPTPENREVRINYGDHYNVVEGYVLPTQEDLEKVQITFEPSQGFFIFWVGSDEFRVYTDCETGPFDEGDCYFNGVFCGNNPIYVDAVDEVFEEQAAVILARLTKVA